MTFFSWGFVQHLSLFDPRQERCTPGANLDLCPQTLDPHGVTTMRMALNLIRTRRKFY
jgi:hypothetical protein